MRRGFRSERLLVRLACWLLVLALLGLTAWRCWPATSKGMKGSTLVVEQRAWYEINVDGKSLLYFKAFESDSTVSGLSVSREQAVDTTYTSGCWINRWVLVPSCRGRLVAALCQPEERKQLSAHAIAATMDSVMLQDIRSLIKENSELEYYLKTHGVNDEGYALVAGLKAHNDTMLTNANLAQEVLHAIQPQQKVDIVRKTSFVAHYHTRMGWTKTVACLLKAYDNDSKTALLQTVGRRTPSGIGVVTMLPWKSDADEHLMAVGHPGIGVGRDFTNRTKPVIVEGQRKAEARPWPKLLVGDGSPVFTQNGTFVGMAADSCIVDRTVLQRLFKKQRSR